jgi:hypothetical protein
MEITILREAAERAANGTVDPEARKRALERMTETRKALEKRMGKVDLVVPMIREARDE